MVNPAIIGRNALLFTKIVEFRRVLISCDSIFPKNQEIVKLHKFHKLIKDAHYCWVV